MCFGIGMGSGMFDLFSNVFHSLLLFVVYLDAFNHCIFCDKKWKQNGEDESHHAEKPEYHHLSMMLPFGGTRVTQDGRNTKPTNEKYVYKYQDDVDTLVHVSEAK